MKKIITIFLFIFSLNINSQTIIAPPNMDSKELMVGFMALHKFIGDSNLVVVVQPNTPLYYGMQGLTQQYHKNFYTISISDKIIDKKIRLWVLLHEIGHVIDFHSGRLNEHPPMWEGNPIDDDIPWMLRPWEISAEDWALMMWLRLVDTNPYIPFYIEE